MNLWGKTLGQLAVMAVALFFLLSCEDETSLLGYKNPVTKFDVSYVDIPVESSVILFDSVRTSNYDASNDLNRWLVGKYTDPRFGDVQSVAFAEFIPTDTLRIGTVVQSGDTVRDIGVFDSVSLQVQHDYYAYGSNGSSFEEINVHEVTESLVAGYFKKTTTSTGGQHKPQETSYPYPQLYFSKNTKTYNPAPLKTKTVTVDLKTYNDEALEEGTSSYDTLLTKFPLPLEFGQRLFDLAKNYPDSFRLRSFFAKHFKGLAFVPGAGNQKIIGIRPGTANTRIELHYHTSKDTLTLLLNFNNLVSFSNITSSRASSEISELTEYFQPVEPANDLRYIQAGTGVVTKIDFSKFLELDTIPYLAINAAELVIKNVEDPQHFAPPAHLLLQLESNNRPKKLAYPGRASARQRDIEDILSYNRYINYNSANYANYYYTISGGVTQWPFDSTFNIMDDLQQSFVTLRYNSETKSYKGAPTLFFQALLDKTEEQRKYTTALLLPYTARTSSNTSDPALGRHTFGKTLNRVAFHKDNIVLRVYYTTPKVSPNE